MELQSFLAYLVIFLSSFGLINGLNGLVNETFYYLLNRATGNQARFLGLLTIIIAILAVFITFKVTDEINLVLALIVFFIPIALYSSYLKYLDRTYKEYQKSKHYKLSLKRVFLTVGVIIVTVVVAFLLLSYIAFRG